MSKIGFEQLIKSGQPYVDKSLFIMHAILQDDLPYVIAMPRGMGTSLNMDMLAEYLDAEKDSRELFDGLKILKWEQFDSFLNRSPVLRFDMDGWGKGRGIKYEMGKALRRGITKYLPEYMRTSEVDLIFKNKSETSAQNLALVLENLYLKVGAPYLLIEGYTDFLLDFSKDSTFNASKRYLRDALEFVLRNRKRPTRIIIAGHTNMEFEFFHQLKLAEPRYSGYFDDDFGLDEAEICSILPESMREPAREWYGEVNISGKLKYTTSSVMSYLAGGELKGHRDDDRVLAKTIRLSGESSKDLIKLIKDIDNTSSIEPYNKEYGADFYGESDILYSVAIRTGVLAYHLFKKDCRYGVEVKIPNKELYSAWIKQVENYAAPSELEAVLMKLADPSLDMEAFTLALRQYLSARMSFFGLEEDAESYAYNLFYFGLCLLPQFDCRKAMGCGEEEMCIIGPGFGAFTIVDKVRKKPDLEFGSKYSLSRIERRDCDDDLEGCALRYGIGIGVYKHYVAVKAARL
ncbi:MAG: AAA family ATPase [Clostridiales bacterium]|jgi:hypothetical protein|nr:AAA family ATPase [Clostridiales bacterium]MDR2750501.1 AAA family ATPase [Clostridiales bacterium]